MQLSENNQVSLQGTIEEAPVFDHQLFGETFFSLKLCVPRLSESSDSLPVTISSRLISEMDMSPGQPLCVHGQLRSYNKFLDGTNRLVLTVFAREAQLEPIPGENPNSVVLSGTLCKPPIYRMTPFKREISDLLLAVNRAYGKSDYIPCIAWGRNARFCEKLRVGDRLEIRGRMQSRPYQKRLEDGTTITKVAYEVSVNQLTLAPVDAPDGAPEEADTQPQEPDDRSTPSSDLSTPAENPIASLTGPDASTSPDVPNAPDTQNAVGDEINGMR